MHVLNELISPWVEEPEMALNAEVGGVSTKEPLRFNNALMSRALYQGELTLLQTDDTVALRVSALSFTIFNLIILIHHYHDSNP